jgi:hypothetical protein
VRIAARTLSTLLKNFKRDLSKRVAFLCLFTPNGLVSLGQSTDIAPSFSISSHIPEP